MENINQFNISKQFSSNINIFSNKTNFNKKDEYKMKQNQLNFLRKQLKMGKPMVLKQIGKKASIKQEQQQKQEDKIARNLKYFQRFQIQQNCQIGQRQVWDTNHFEKKIKKDIFCLEDQYNKLPRSISIDLIEFGGKCKKFHKISLLEFKTEMLKLSLLKVKTNLNIKLIMNVRDKTPKFFYSKLINKRLEQNQKQNTDQDFQIQEAKSPNYLFTKKSTVKLMQKHKENVQKQFQISIKKINFKKFEPLKIQKSISQHSNLKNTITTKTNSYQVKPFYGVKQKILDINKDESLFSYQYNISDMNQRYKNYQYDNKNYRSYISLKNTQNDKY